MNDRRGIVPLVLAVLGLIVMAVTFPLGITAALDGGGAGSLVYQVLFLVGMIGVIASLIVAVVNLIRGHARVLSIVTLVIAFLPLAGVAALIIVNR